VKQAAERHRARWVIVLATLLFLIIAIVLWRFTSLADWLTPQRLSRWIAEFRNEPWAPLAIVGIFIVGGLIALPLMLMLGATALVLEPLTAFVVSMTGALASAIVTHFVGAHFIRNTAHTAFGPTLEKVRKGLSGKGVIAIATVRMVPIAPYTLVNLAAGSIGVPLVEFLVGTALGLTPGMIAITAFGGQLRAVIEQPTPLRVATLSAIVVGWVALSLLLQRWLARRQDH
jgi:uncharacterized membrane protein YdjX (TVP38/TMEM64 family)